MKKLMLVALGVFLFTFGCAYYWLSSQPIYSYDYNAIEYEYSRGVIPVKNNCFITRYKVGGKYEFQIKGNVILPSGFPNLEEIKTFSPSDYKWVFVKDDELFDVANIIKFTIKNEKIIYYCERRNPREDLLFYRILSIDNGEKNTFKTKQELEQNIGYKIEQDMKTHDEWFDIWKRDGRLPWFPEHVGR